MESAMRFTEDIGLFTIDRPTSSCRHRTSYCSKNCYNNKLYKCYSSMHKKDVRNEEYWQSISGEGLALELSQKRRQTKRIRLMSRGEAFSTQDDINRVIDLAKYNTRRLFWIPTRAWRDNTLRAILENKVSKIKNIRLLASIDPSNTPEEIQSLQSTGWSLMGFGWDSPQSMTTELSIQGTIKHCPKTKDHVTGHCAKCQGGCFSPKQTTIFLDKH